MDSILNLNSLINLLRYRSGLLLANRDITITPHLYGEDYYIYVLIEKLKRNGVHVDLLVDRGSKGECLWQGNLLSTSVNELVKDYDFLILHNISPLKVWRAKFKRKLKIIMPVYFLWNLELSIVSNIRGRLGLTLWQLMIDEYIAPSLSIVRGLRLQGILKKIYLIPPTYKCKYCDFRENVEKLTKLKDELPINVKVTYIGSLSPRRLPLSDVVKMFNSDRSRTYEIFIYTATPTEERVYKIGNVKVRIMRRILSDHEKCKVLCESHLFIAPRHKTSLEPSISAIEAEYHGNVVLRDL